MKKQLSIVILTVFIDVLGLGILIPVIPQLLANPASPYNLLPANVPISQGYILLGYLTAIYPIMQFIAAPILGQLSDRFGRKKVLAFSLFGTSVGYAVFAIGILTRSIPILFLGRILDGITGGNISVAQAAIADITPPEKRARNFGLMGAVFGLGFILGPYIGGKLSDPSIIPWFHAATPFWFAGILALVNTLSVLFFFPETLQNLQSHVRIAWSQSVRHIVKAFTLPGVRSLFATNFLYQAGFTFFVTFFSVFLINKFGFTQGNIGDFFAYVGLWIAFTQAFITRSLATRLPERTILSFSVPATGVVVACFFFPQVWWGLLFVVPFLAICNGLSQANLPGLISRSVGPEIQGEILGINASVQALAQAIPPVLSGYIAARLTPETPIIVSSAVLILSGLVFAFANRRARPAHAE